MTKIEPITSKFNKELRTKFLNSVSMFHRRLVLQICNCHRLYSVTDVFIACMKNLKGRVNSGNSCYDSVQNLFKAIGHKSVKHNHIYGN